MDIPTPPIPFRALAALALGTLLAACGQDGPGAGPGEEPPGDAPSNRVDIPASVRDNLGISFAKVERRDLASTIRLPGAFELTPMAMREYRAMSSGRVEFAVDQLEGVRRGDLLFRLHSPRWGELQTRIDLARASLDQASAKLEVARSRILALNEAGFRRAELNAQRAELEADRIRGEAELDAALNEAARMLNNYAPAAEGAFTPEDLLASAGGAERFYQTIESIEVRAGGDGVVEAIAVADGAFVEQSTLVLKVVDPSRVRFRALGLQSDLAKFEGASHARIVPPRARGTDANEALPAALRVGLAADPGRRTVTVYGVPDEARPWARAGVSAFLEVAAESTGGAVLAIPRSAVVKDGIVHVFFKRDPLDPNRAIRVEADLGIDDGRWVEVKSELGPQDEVVLHGAYELKLATAQSGTSQKGGHFHADGTYHEEAH